MNIDIDQAKSACLRLNAKIVDFLIEHTKDKKRSVRQPWNLSSLLHPLPHRFAGRSEGE